MATKNYFGFYLLVAEIGKSYVSFTRKYKKITEAYSSNLSEAFSEEQERTKIHL